ncbi:MAG: hypothetical protein SGARI_003340 [Bacillariaceae sp.]
MGKRRFAQIYCKIRKALRLADDEPCTIKISYFCDPYSPRKKYAGIIIYHHDGETKWVNQDGVAQGHRCQSFYVLIKCTDKWEAGDFRRAGSGMVHDKMYKEMFGQSFEGQVTCCGGFAIMEGEKKYSSWWLNDQSSRKKGTKWSWSSDGKKDLSPEEIEIVDTAIEAWKIKGRNVVIEVPEDTDYYLRERGAKA